MGGQSGVVLVGAALAGLDQRQQGVCRSHQIVVDLLCPLTSFEGGFPAHANALSEGHELTRYQIILRAAEGGLGLIAQFLQGFLEGFAASFVAVVDKNHLGLFRKAPQPVQQPIPVGVAGCAM